MYQKTMDLMMDPVKEGFREIWKGEGAAKATLRSSFRTFPMTWKLWAAPSCVCNRYWRPLRSVQRYWVYSEMCQLDCHDRRVSSNSICSRP